MLELLGTTIVAASALVPRPKGLILQNPVPKAPTQLGWFAQKGIIKRLILILFYSQILRIYPIVTKFYSNYALLSSRLPYLRKITNLSLKLLDKMNRAQL